MALETKDNLINKQSRFLNFNNDLIQVHIHKYIQMFNIITLELTIALMDL